MTPDEGLTLNVGDRVHWTSAIRSVHGKVIDKFNDGILLLWEDGCAGDFKFGDDSIRWDRLEKMV